MKLSYHLKEERLWQAFDLRQAQEDEFRYDFALGDLVLEGSRDRSQRSLGLDTASRFFPLMANNCPSVRER